MTTVKFGPLYTRIHELVSVKEFADATVQMKFDSLWVPDTMVTREHGLDCMPTLGAFVEHTEQIMLGTCVVVVPLRHPAILAKEVATLDYLSGGRIIFGVGVGPRANRNLEAAGIDPRERGARTDEALEIMTGLWSDEPFSHKGRFYEFEDMYMEPKPVQRPGPPIWFGGHSEGALRRAGRWGDGFMPTSLTAATYQRAMMKIERYAEELDRDPNGVTRALLLSFRVAESEAEASGRASDDMSNRMGRRYEIVPHQGAIGTVDDCLRAVERYMSCGVKHFVVNPICKRPEYMGQMEIFATQIMPRFK